MVMLPVDLIVYLIRQYKRLRGKAISIAPSRGAAAEPAANRHGALLPRRGAKIPCWQRRAPAWMTAAGRLIFALVAGSNLWLLMAGTAT